MNQISVTDHGFQVRPFRDLALDAGYTAHLLLVVAVDHRQRQRAIALQLNGNIAGELQRGGQQAGGQPAVPPARFSPAAGSYGWSESVLKFLKRLPAHRVRHSFQTDSGVIDRVES